MTIQEVITILIETDNPPPAYKLIELAEASVHLPHRGRRWMASYRDENGVQRWKPTGERDRAAAQSIADRLEHEAKAKRAAQAPRPKKPTIRVRPSSAERAVGLLSQKEVAVFLKMSERAVRETERSAFEKIRNHPVMRKFWREWQGGEIDESDLRADWELSTSEISALYAMARTPEERHVLRKLLALTASL